MKEGIKEKYNSIDLFKFLMACCVIAIHTQPFFGCSNFLVKKVYDSIVNCAVPFFFMASGFLLAVKLKWPYSLKENEVILKKYLVRIMKMYALWSLIYLPLAIFYYMRCKLTLFYSLRKYIFDFVFVGEHYNSWMLWYLLSTIYAILFILVLLKRNVSINLITFLGLVILFFSFVIDEIVSVDNEALLPILVIVQRIIKNTIVSGRILRGLFYIPCGMLIARKKLPLVINSIIFSLFFVLRCTVQAGLINELCTFMCSISLFQLVLSINLKDAKIYPILRKISLSMYLVHMYIWTIYYSLIYHKKTYGFDCFIVTLVISVCVALVQYHISLSRRKKYIHSKSE